MGWCGMVLYGFACFVFDDGVDVADDWVVVGVVAVVWIDAGCGV